jgi:hypothetical protein
MNEPTNEPLLARIRVLEAAVSRWRSISVSLFLFIVCSMILGGTGSAIFLMKEHREGLALQMEAAAVAEQARADALAARAAAEQALAEERKAQERLGQLQKGVDELNKVDPEP